MNFFKSECKSGPFNHVKFGLCDDQNSTPAYVDTTAPSKWVATVENPSQRPVIFTAIDKCVINDGDAVGQQRCDGMLTTNDLLYLVELKNKNSNWQALALEQLESTIKLLRELHDLTSFRSKKAFACNKQRKPFVVIDHELKRRFFRDYGFRIDIQVTISVP